MGNTNNRSWLSPDDHPRYTALIEQVGRLWSSGVDPQSFTPHDPGHFRRVEKNIQGLIPRQRWDLLIDEERFLLSCAAWTHDIAMNPSAHFIRTDKSGAEIRRQHVDESADWVMRERRAFGLSFSEATVLSEVNLHHSRRYRIDSCSETRVCNGVVVRPRLMASYLRLADAIEVGHERVDDWEIQRFLFLQEAISKNAEETLFHWIKSFIVSGITASVADQRILVEFQIPESVARKIAKLTRHPDKPVQLSFEQAKQDAGFSLLSRFILDEVNEELETVEEVLAIGGVSSYHFVAASDAVVVLPERISPKWSSGLTRVVNDLRVAHSPNSSGTATAALNAIGDTLDVATLRATKGDSTIQCSFESKDACQIEIPLDLVSDVMAQLRKNLQARLESRMCHVELKRVSDFVVALATNIMEQGTLQDCRDWLVALDEFRRKMGAVVDRPNSIESDTAAQFWKHCLTLPGIKEREQLTVLLFGNSGTVANVIAQHKHYGVKNLFCYVAEGRPKSMHGARNQPTYLDVEAYSQTLRDAEKKCHEDKAMSIRVIPDIAVGTVLDPSHASGRDAEKYPPVDAVVFGANGVFVNSDDDVTIAHTCGHLSIAATARQLNVPVFVVASAAKVQSQPMGDWQTATREDKGRWIGSASSGVLDGLKKLDAHTDWNPREDHVPINLLDAIFTDLGLCQCDDPKQVADRLRDFEKTIDDEVEQHRFKSGRGVSDPPSKSIDVPAGKPKTKGRRSSRRKSNKGQ